ncbi:MAG: DUF998 domain-containing protein [Methanomassiliicoccaceae archaeon]|nr:DUF998 domain-containing protein [Methanomassiliicoccaceae archaeon]
MTLVKERNVFIGITALIAVTVFASFWFFAAMNDISWIFGTNYLSDLGVSDSQMAYRVFNAGCIIAGALFAISGAAIVLTKKKKILGAAGAFAVIAGIMIALVGVVTEDVGDPHSLIALTGFGLAMISLVLLAVNDWRDSLRQLAVITPILILVALVTYFILGMPGIESVDIAGYDIGPLSGMPGIETVITLIILFLFMLQGMKFVYHGAQDIATPDGRGVADRHKVGVGFAALASMTAFLFFWLFAILSDPSWTFGTDPGLLLGNSTVGDTSFYYSAGCFFGGLFLIAYGVGSGMMTRGRLRSYSGFFAVLTGMVLILKALTFLGAAEIWEYAEYLAAILGAITLLFIVASDWVRKRMVFAAFYLLILATAIICLIVYGYEAAASACILMLFLMLGIEGIRLFFEE